jgi:phage gpG-like protein
MVPSKLLQNILSDIRIEINEENDKNFTRKAFFTEKWARRKYPYPQGTLMSKSGNLRKSIKATISTSGISFTSDLPYAAIHNEGGEIILVSSL